MEWIIDSACTTSRVVNGTLALVVNLYKECVPTECGVSPYLGNLMNAQTNRRNWSSIGKTISPSLMPRPNLGHRSAFNRLIAWGISKVFSEHLQSSCTTYSAEMIAFYN